MSTEQRKWWYLPKQYSWDFTFGTVATMRLGIAQSLAWGHPADDEGTEHFDLFKVRYTKFPHFDGSKGHVVVLTFLPFNLLIGWNTECPEDSSPSTQS